MSLLRSLEITPPAATSRSSADDDADATSAIDGALRRRCRATSRARSRGRWAGPPATVRDGLFVTSSPGAFTVSSYPQRAARAGDGERPRHATSRSPTPGGRGGAVRARSRAARGSRWRTCSTARSSRLTLGDGRCTSRLSHASQSIARVWFHQDARRPVDVRALPGDPQRADGLRDHRRPRARRLARRRQRGAEMNLRVRLTAPTVRSSPSAPRGSLDLRQPPPARSTLVDAPRRQRRRRSYRAT